MTAPKPFPTIYKDGSALYLEWPERALRFDFTQAGLAKALLSIPTITSHPGYLTGGTNLPKAKPIDPFALTKRQSVKVSPATLAKRQLNSCSDAMRAGASALLRKKGIVE